MSIVRKGFLVAMSSLIFAATSMAIIAPPVFAGGPIAGKPCKVNGQKITHGSVIFACHPKVVGNTEALIWYLKDKTPRPNTSTTSARENPVPATTQNQANNVSWQFNGNGYTSTGNPPKCVFPIIPDGSFVDFKSALSKLAPGQSRGGSYKPHGGIRWSDVTYKPDITVTSPFDGTIVTGWQYLVGGVYQFGFNIVNPCGIMLRIGHMNVPSAFSKEILSKLPVAQEGDSRESSLNVKITKGTLIASQVGIPTGTPDTVGAMIDFGLLDLRNRNPKLPANFSSNASPQYSLYSVCWYEGDWLGPTDKALAVNLPFPNGDGSSDYC